MNQQPPVAIASALTFWSKLAEPMVDLVLLGAAVLWGGVGIYKLDGRSALMAIAIGGVVVVRRYVRRKMGHVVDGVWDCGDHLVIRDGGKERSLDLKSILEVQRCHYPPHLRIISSDGSLQQTTTFIPPKFSAKRIQNELESRAKAFREKSQIYVADIVPGET